MNDVKCKYTVALGLIEALMAITKLEKQEVWARLADEVRVCTDRQVSKGTSYSYRWVVFPGTSIRVKIETEKVNTRGQVRGEGQPNYFKANIEFKTREHESFTSEQVDDFLIGEILLK